MWLTQRHPCSQTLTVSSCVLGRFFPHEGSNSCSLSSQGRACTVVGNPARPEWVFFLRAHPEYQTLSSGKITSSCTLSVTTAEPLAFTRCYFLLGLHQLLSQALKLIQMPSGSSAFSLIPLWKYIFQSNMAYMLFWGADKKQISLPSQVWKSFILWLLRTLGSCALKLVLLFSVFSESERYRNASVLMAFIPPGGDPVVCKCRGLKDSVSLLVNFAVLAESHNWEAKPRSHKPQLVGQGSR